MSGQLIAVIVLVALASLYVLRVFALALSARSKSSCGGGCWKCSNVGADKTKVGVIPLKQVQTRG